MTHKVAGYEISLRKRLGKGAYGSVYSATDKRGNKVAAKEIEKDSTSRGALREIDNANKQKQLNHDNIVKIIETYNADDEVWLFLELCDGGDLNSFCRAHFEEFAAIKLTIMMDIARGLSFLHEKRISHRDIKPENILIQQENGMQCVKLTDFGLSKFHPADSPTSAMHTNLGTHTYKAPEFWDINQDGELTYHNRASQNSHFFLDQCPLLTN